ncbi:MAG: polymerase [Candidatus Dependentiae bacterium]|nr:polymerase [Candidatus Dependentiae bacterium]
MKPTSLHIIDGSSLLYRSYYGVRPLHTAAGVATQAIYGFCRTLKKITDDLKPTNLIIVWDSKGPTIRHAEYTDYKATRQSPPSDLIVQKEAIIAFATSIGIAQLAAPGHEADDIIYSILKEHPDVPATVITGDKDLHQLLNGHVAIFDPFKQITITHDSFVTERGFTPQDLLLYHSLLGDSSDNIPGVKGIGAKTAQGLAQHYHTVTNLYDSLEALSSKRTQELLALSKEAAFLSEKLFTLRYHPTHFAIEHSHYDKNKWLQATPFFRQYDIKPLLPNGVVNAPLFAPATDDQLIEKPRFTTHIITTELQLAGLINKIKQAAYTAFDTETYSLQPFRDGLVGVSCAYNGQEGYYIPFGHVGHITNQEQLARETVLEAFKPIFSDSAISKVFHHAKFDQSGLAYYGLQLNGVIGDTLIIASLLRVGSESIGLKALSSRYLHEDMVEFSDLVKGKKTFADVEIGVAAQYAANDARQTWQLHELLRKKLAQDPVLESLYQNVELPLSKLLWKMEEFGINLDIPLVEKLAAQTQEELDLITAKIGACLHGGQQMIVAPTLNLNSPQQLEVLLFDQLKLPSLKKNTKTGSRSTDSEVLAELSKIHPVPGLIMHYRELSKLLNTYLLPLPQEINPRTGKIHTTYTQTITATGRLSSTNPNLQNIPTESAIRNAFVAPEGYLFIAADYSQIELRILAQFSQDQALLDAFAHQKDVHSQTAALIFNVPVTEVTPEQRSVGKKINFSIMYGLTPFGLSKDLGISPASAKQYIESYFTQYAGVKRWMEQTVQEAKETGFVTTLLGRKRHVPGLNERNHTLQEAERRITINTPIQGTSADIIKMAMLKLDAEIQRRGIDAHLVLQIHDELLIAVRPEALESMIPLIKECMSSVVTGWDVPLEVSVKSGSCWGSLNLVPL